MRITIILLVIFGSTLSVTGQYVYGDPATKRYFGIDCEEVGSIPNGTARGFKSPAAAEEAGFSRSEVCSKRGDAKGRIAGRLPAQPARKPEIPKPTSPVEHSRGVQSNAGTAKIDAKSIYKKAEKSVVFITTIKPDETAYGSGVILRSDGIIATNYHVIADATAARIKLSNGDIYDDVFVVETDSRKDIAILRIRGVNLPVLEAADSQPVEVGEKIYTIGAPDGLQGSYSDGLVSGLRPANEYSPNLSGFQIIQFTAPVSPGSSGGAL